MKPKKVEEPQRTLASLCNIYIHKQTLKEDVHHPRELKLV